MMESRLGSAQECKGPASMVTSAGDPAPEPINDNDASQADKNEHPIDPECERLLRVTKKQVKQIMEEAVTKKVIYVDSGSIVSLCVAVDGCLSHGLKRRVLGLFKTSSSTALIHKMAKNCPQARGILNAMERDKTRAEQLSLKMADQKSGEAKVNELSNNMLQHNRRYYWIKVALIERKLVELVEYLATNAAKYYEPEGLLMDRVCAQILCSLLVGPSLLEFSRSQTNNYQCEDPTAHELIKRHKLANPIACLCDNQVKGRKEVAAHLTNSSESAAGGRRRNSTGGRENLHDDDCREEEQTTNGSTKTTSGQHGTINRRRPLSIKTNTRRAMLMTNCHHLSCQEIGQHQQSRGYSLMHTPMSAPSSGCNVSGNPQVIFPNQQRQQQQSASNANNEIKVSGNQTTTETKTMFNGMIKTLPVSRQDQSWVVWSPKLLHEIMHQNSRYKLVYAKNNILLESHSDLITPGYLSLHQTKEDLYLKWIPNQMINGAQELNNNCHKNDKQDELGTTTFHEPTPIQSSYLELVVSIPISQIALLHCRFQSPEDPSNLIHNPNGGANTQGKFTMPLDQIKEHNSNTTSLDQPEISEKSSPDMTTSIDDKTDEPTGEAESQILDSSRFSNKASWEETLILVEADGIQRAPFKFPKGGLRLFLSCLQTGLAPNRYLDPAMNFDQPTTDAPVTDTPSNTPVESNLGESKSVMSDESASRLDSILRRFPSLRRKKMNSKEVAANNDSNCCENLATNSDLNETDLMGNKSQSSMIATNNYVYRIVVSSSSMDQQEQRNGNYSEGWFFKGLDRRSSSPGFSTNGKATMSASASSNMFRWSLRKWANLSKSSRASQNSSSSISTSFGPQTGSSSGNSYLSNSEQTFDQTTTMTSELEQNTSMTNVSCDDLVPSIDHMSEDSSRKLARMEAKLCEIKKSTSEEVLETFRTQSIQVLCESMRRQILARAFYGWLVHCRRARIIKQHLHHLIRDIPVESSPTPMSMDGDFRSGLTKDKWLSLMAEKSTDIGHLVALYVYHGGIESDELRKEVWPFLLGHYDFRDTSRPNRKRKDSLEAKHYESCLAQWGVIATEVRARDNEILASNMAKAKRESREAQERQTGDVKKDDKMNGLTEKIIDNCDNKTDIETKSTEQVICSTADDLVDGAISQSLDSICKGSSINMTNKKNQDDEAKDDFKEEITDSGNQRDSEIGKRFQRKKRWRLESTGSVGSDASITDQFGNNMHRIDKDVQRCDRNFWYFKETGN